MSTETGKRINASFAVRTVKNVIKMYTTLSDRLKQAGIKENKPKCPGKGCKHKNTKRNRKTQIKKGHSKVYMNSSFQRTKKLRKPLKHFVTPYLDKSVQNDPPQVEVLSKQFETIPEDKAEEAENNEKETIFVSLDFIEECQNYKKKVRKPKDHIRKSLRSLTGYQKPGSDTRGSSRKSGESAEKVEASPSEDQRGDAAKLPEENSDGAEDESEKLRSATEKELTEALQSVKPLLSKLSSEDIAKIDKKYLESILTFATKLEAKKKALEDEGENKPNDTLGEARKKLTGRDFFELKLKTREFQEEAQREDSSSGLGETEWKENSPCTEARIVRDLTKSEEQIKLKKGKNLFDSYNNSKMKTKNLTHSKPDIKDISRKKRKPRNKCMKNNAEEFIETSLPSEVSRVADVKELWRRKTLLKKSENSLTSHSSCTVPESDEYPASKNLESYKILKKLVEEEIKNISKKSENKNNTGEVKTKENNSKQPELTKKPPLCRKTNEVPILKRRLMQAEGKMEKSELLNFLDDDIPKEANPKLANAEDKTKGGRVPSKVIENWSILNRLEQAFLGLGTPTFPDKNMKGNMKSKHVSGNEGSTTAAEKLLKEAKKVQKYRDVLARKENRGSTAQKNSTKTVKKTDSGVKLNVSKEEETSVKPKRAGKQEAPERNTLRGEEANLKQKKKKLQNRPDNTRKASPNLANLRREANESPLTPSKARLYIKPKYQKTSKKKASNARKLSTENLERKKTFDIIPAIDESIVQPRKSKSCGINDTNLEGRFSSTKNQVKNSFSKDDQKIRSRSIENDGVTKTMSPLPKRLAKNSMKGTCEQHSKISGPIKSVGEKESLKRETAPRGRSNQGKEVKNSGELQKDVFPGSNKTCIKDDDKRNSTNDDDNKKNIEDKDSSNGNTARERAVKKRSIHSVHVNQHCDQTPRKLLQIKEKEASAGSLEHVYKESHKDLKTSFSNISAISTETFDLVDLTVPAKDKNTGQPSPRQQGRPETPQRLTVSSISNALKREDNDELEHDPSEWKTRKQPLWEQDMTHYRTIVREIMSQYKRIDGFLKQNEQLNNFTDDHASLCAESNDNDSNKLCNDSQLLNIHEYRKKIISEYKEMPIFEYKSKLEQNKDGSCSESLRKRNLVVVKDLNTGADDDVKDYHPKIQKVLDSQLYVDTERLVKRNEPNGKISEKLSSLQDIVLRKNEEKAMREEWQRRNSTSKSFQRQRSYVILSSAQIFGSQDNCIDNATSDSTTCYGQETETDSCQEVPGY